MLLACSSGQRKLKFASDQVLVYKRPRLRLSSNYAHYGSTQARGVATAKPQTTTNNAEYVIKYAQCAFYTA